MKPLLSSKQVGASGLGEAILAVFRATNLVSPFEKVRLQDVLRGPAADAFIRAAVRFALGEGKSALLDMERALKLPSESPGFRRKAEDAEECAIEDVNEWA